MARALFHTLGCKLNFAETATIAAMLAERGVAACAPGEEPDIIVVNTCSVTGQADHKCRAAIRALRRRHPAAAVVVTGCYAQLQPEVLAAIEGVAVVAGNDRKDRIAAYVDRWLAERRHLVEVTPAAQIRRFTPAGERGERTRYFLKVQDGCDYWCSYCTIPAARGRSRSPRIDEVLNMVEQAAERGVKEVVLTGVNTGDFGRDSGETFGQLVNALSIKAPAAIRRFRISSVEPNLLTDEILDIVATPGSRFMPHFHIPLQSGSDEVLRLMRRRYDTALFASRIAAVRRRLPDAFIGVDVIVGARGETAEEFERSLAFCEAIDVSRYHVFPYSERPGTAALKIPHRVDEQEKHERTARLLAVSDAKERGFAMRFAGQQARVLVEDNGAGFTDNYLRVHISPEPEGNVEALVRLSDTLRPDGAFDATLISTLP